MTSTANSSPSDRKEVRRRPQRPAGQRFAPARHAALAALAASACLGVLGCVSSSEDAEQGTIDGQEDPVVYGNDDRKDFFQESSEAKKRLTRESIVALIGEGSLRRSSDGTYSVRGRESQLCAGERFAGQVDAAYCSGTLIDDDLVLTAGHCIDRCDGTRFVFNYLYEGEGRLATIRDQDVYACRQVVAHSDRADHAVVRLDRKVEGGHKPAAIRRGASLLNANQALVMVGMGIGLPAKIDSGGRVTVPDAGGRLSFSATVDAFGGNSGSGVFTSDLQLTGILSGGQQDFIQDGGCLRVNRLPADQRNAERVMYSFHAIDAVCSGSRPIGSSRLCSSDTGNAVVKLYQHTNFGGYEISLPVGEYSLAALLGRGAKNDDISSIRVARGFRATLFADDNFRGASLSKTADDSTLRDDTSGNAHWNDRLTSLRITASP